LKVKAKKLWEAIFFNRRFHDVQFVDRDDLQAWFDPMQQHRQCVTHQGVVVNDVNSHVLISALI
jgi:hypothetical protein